MTIRLLAAVQDPSLLLFGGVAIVLLIIVIIAKLKHNAFIRTCEEVAEQLGGEYRNETAFEFAAIQFRIEGRLAAIDFSQAKGHATTATVAPMLKVTVVVPVEVGIGLLEISSLI